MAFNDRDASADKTITEVSSIEEIGIKRNRDLPGIQLEIVVVKRVNGRDVVGKVPQNLIDAAWPTLRPRLLAIIDAAVFG